MAAAAILPYGRNLLLMREEREIQIRPPQSDVEVAPVAWARARQPVVQMTAPYRQVMTDDVPAPTTTAPTRHGCKLHRLVSVFPSPA